MRFRGRRRLVSLAVAGSAISLVVLWRAGEWLIVAREISRPDAILLLASHEWERLPAVAERARQVPSAAVLLSVPRVITRYNCHRCLERGDWLVSLGVAPEQLARLPRGVASTHDEAIAALAYCRSQGYRRLLVVTSRYHTRRALATFEHVFDGSGVEVGIEASVRHSRAMPARWWSDPYDRWYVRYEWAAIVFYLVRYGITPFA